MSGHCRSMRRMVLLVVLVTAVLHTCTGETAFCDSVQSVSEKSLVMRFEAGLQTRTQCTCILTPSGTRGLLRLAVTLNRLEDREFSEDSAGGRNSNTSCEPFTTVQWGQRDMVSQCAIKQNEQSSANNRPKITVVRTTSEAVRLTLYNHKRREINAHMEVQVLEGSVDLNCYPETESMRWEADTCPCDIKPLVIGGGIGGNPNLLATGDVSTGQTGLTVGLVCVAIFILILLIVAGIWWYRKQDPAGEKDLEAVTAGNVASDNAAYAHSTSASRASGMDRTPHDHNSPPAHAPYGTDPELDLNLRTAPQDKPSNTKGSSDSGIYSMPAEKPPPNNNYANLPLGPDQMYNPMLSKQPSVHSLTGQGALHSSVDHLNPPDVVYAQPHKKQTPRNAPPTRSASHDALNQRPDAVSGDLSAARSRSHNTSMASVGSVVETDV